jgi:hypothetical protein
MSNRFGYLAVAIVATFVLTGCQTMQKSGNTTSAAAELPNDTQKVKGINDWEGEITGKPAPGSTFRKLQIGMSMKQVIDLIGPPTDQGAYMTGKAWIPFYFGSDRTRHELVYKGLGRLIFAGGSRFDFTSRHLIMIIHNAQESGYR